MGEMLQQKKPKVTCGVQASGYLNTCQEPESLKPQDMHGNIYVRIYTHNTNTCIRTYIQCNNIMYRGSLEIWGIYCLLWGSLLLNLDTASDSSKNLQTP